MSKKPPRGQGAPSVRKPPPRTYHHGDLRQALVAAAEAILAERGVEGLSLREAARRAGVSPAAPAHHFGSLAGLMTEVAILGFEALGAELAAGNERGGGDPAARLREQGVGYVRFALAHPGRFMLMFRRELLQEDPRLKKSAATAFSALADAVREIAGDERPGPLEGPTLALLLLAWSSVHGFAHLALEGELRLFRGGTDIDAFAEEMLPRIMSLLPTGRRPEKAKEP